MMKAEEKMKNEKIPEEEFTSFLEELIGTKAKLRTFEYLLDNTIFECTVEDICEGTNLSRLSVAKALKTFLKYGIVRVTRRVGRATFYRIDLENPIVEAISEFNMKLTKIVLAMERGELKL